MQTEFITITADELQKMKFNEVPDWADKIARRITGNGKNKELVAYALRKAKADGMREAWDMVDKLDPDLREIADAVERGEAQ